MRTVTRRSGSRTVYTIWWDYIINPISRKNKQGISAKHNCLSWAGAAAEAGPSLKPLPWLGAHSEMEAGWFSPCLVLPLPPPHATAASPPPALTDALLSKILPHSLFPPAPSRKLLCPLLNGLISTSSTFSHGQELLMTCDMLPTNWAGRKSHLMQEYSN